MPHIESELARVHGYQFFATFDLSHGYWKLLLDPDSQECQSFLTPDGVFTPTRVLHGTSNAMMHMQSALQGAFTPLAEHLLSWLDDLLLHATTVDKFLHYLRTFFTLCREFNTHLHPGKSLLFARAARWCGRIISGDGVRSDPRRAQGFLDMSMPVSGADLQQFVCALNWMRTATPVLHTISFPFTTPS
jgi:Reverse transcriptase (RNA-dependent DNA polymerase)